MWVAAPVGGTVPAAGGPPTRWSCDRPGRSGGWKTGPVRISARADYALRAAVELAAAGGGPVKLEQLASTQDLPPKFLETILGELRRAGLLRTQRGADGGYWLARPSSARSAWRTWPRAASPTSWPSSPGTPTPGCRTDGRGGTWRGA